MPPQPRKRHFSVESGELVIDPKDENIVHTIGAHFNASGSLEFEGNDGVHFGGRLAQGSISAPEATVIVGADARINGAIAARRVFVLGEVRGPIKATECLVIAGTVDAEGCDIEYGALEVSLDATVNGNLRRVR
jgi:cytoskeletal protein CcmA (bactofilin family)